jgi:23S rRNA pseudouridine2605 synthase
VRLSKYLASAGVAARRKAEEVILSGRVTIDGETVTDPAFDISSQRVLLDDREIAPSEKVYYLLDKPAGFTSSTADEHAEKLVTELVPSEPSVWPVGRLDRETAGLIILTNDGELTQNLTHPSREKEKEYEMTVDRPLSRSEQDFLRQGIELEDGPFKPDQFTEISNGKYRIVVHEGRNRLIRRAISYFGKEITTLTRTRIAFITLSGLEPGKYRELTKNEVGRLKNA